MVFWINTQGGQALPLYNNGGMLTTDSSRTVADKSTSFKKVTQPLSGNIQAGSQGDLSFRLDGSTWRPAPTRWWRRASQAR